ncbi:diguanylate cyclase (GGDEF) domain-containing protein [Amphibacillus marinus]|uniref:Diguanylate cyclase (GGDEF) domain-containing protein n=1 Tax=Amphibacillus marinus TaxID=872970 RepID=A0A1H8REP8_9BACI|nr:EAL domain-containing protein [Amphibacillus marinus]SEO64836.1 diguanylate cyclase (GGDEF) domain-containing protein [Amphibacillus marinus]
MIINPIDRAIHASKSNDLKTWLATISHQVDIPINVLTELKAYINNNQINQQISKVFQLLIMNEKGYITYIDEGFCCHLGYQIDELLHHHYRILHAGVHSEGFYQDMWQTIKNGDVWRGDICTSSKSKGMFWYRACIIPFVVEADGQKSFAVFRTDISDVKRYDKLLIENLDDDYRRVFSHLVNLTFRVQRHNESGFYAFRMFEGKLAHKVLELVNDAEGETVDSVFYNHRDHSIRSHFDQAFEGKEVTFKHRHKTLSLFTMLTPLYENGQVIEVIGSSIDITSLEKAEEKVKELEYYDSLTKLPNRTKFRKDLQHLVETPNIGGFAVLFCDIDRLKYINDTLGETIGDQVIEIISQRVNNKLADYGVLYRYGGDEFSLIIHTDIKIAKQISEQLLSEIKKPIAIQGNEFFVTTSIGASYYQLDAWSSRELINHASISVHYCKINGRNSSFFYSSKMDKIYNDMLLIEVDIRKALQNNEFKLFYQPQIDVLSEKVIGLEALIRWNHPLKGAIPPSTFIPLAEESGLITQIGEWVIREACQQFMIWRVKGYQPLRIAVNVSAIELQRFDFADKVAIIINETEMDPAYLEFEITENSVMQNTEDCIKTMNTLRKMGISLSIDDFGTGYSSFGYLKKFPINYLKIDQSFIRSALTEASSAEIVKAMIQLAHNFDLKVVAEGVEEANILSLLRDHHCDYYQGYFYSKPLPIEQLETTVLCKTTNY